MSMYTRFDGNTLCYHNQSQIFLKLLQIECNDFFVKNERIKLRNLAPIYSLMRTKILLFSTNTDVLQH